MKPKRLQHISLAPTSGGLHLRVPGPSCSWWQATTREEFQQQLARHVQRMRLNLPDWPTSGSQTLRREQD